MHMPKPSQGQKHLTHYSKDSLHLLMSGKLNCGTKSPHMPHCTLKNTIASGSHVLVCSDAALDPAKFSMFFWIIHSTQALWSGNGIVLGHLKDVYSGWSEAFGILTGLCCLLNYMANFPITYLNETPTISILCNGKSVIDWLTRIQNATIINSQDTVADDNNMYSKIIYTIQQLQPFQIKLVCVKGHQDCLCKKRLTLAEQLNVECDQQASKYLKVTRSLPPQPNPMLPHGYPHLTIQGATIVCNLAASLQHAATTQHYHNYMWQKHKWTPQDCKNINWVALKYALHRITNNDWPRIQKFLHDWLPLCGHKGTNQPLN